MKFQAHRRCVPPISRELTDDGRGTGQLGNVSALGGTLHGAHSSDGGPTPRSLPRMSRRTRTGPPDEPVELVSLGATEAEMVASRLRSEGVEAVVFSAGSVADLVAIQFSHGSRVMVRRDQLPVAASLLAAWGGPDRAATRVDDADLSDQAIAAGDDLDFGDGARV